MHPRSLSRVSMVAGWGFCSIAIAATAFLVAQTISVTVQTHTDVPLMDEWYNLLVFKSLVDGRNILDALLSQHNEHRIAFPKLILFSDYLYFGGRGWFDFGAILTLQILHAALLSGLLLGATPRRPITIALATLPFLLLFSLRQSENFAWNFQVTFISVFALSSLAIALFSAATDLRHSRAFRLTIVAASFLTAAAAGVSMTNGLIAALVLVIVALAARTYRLALAATLFAALLIAVFSIDYSPGAGHESVDGWIHNPGRLLTFTANYLGNFLDNDVPYATVLGAWGLVATAGMALAILIRSEQNPARLALFGIVLFTAGSAFLTALGRSSDGLEGAMSSRYATGTAAFWSALIGLAWSMAGDIARPIAVRGLVLATSIVLIIAVVEAQPPGRRAMRDQAFEQAVFENGLLQGFVDADRLVALQDIPEGVPEGLAFLKARRMSLFASDEAGMLGEPVIGAAAASPCPGIFKDALTAPELGPNAVRVTGLGAGPPTSDMRRIVLTDGAGKVVGLASTRFGASDWTGYATATPGTLLTGYAQLSAGRWCRIAQRAVSDPPPAP